MTEKIIEIRTRITETVCIPDYSNYERRLQYIELRGRILELRYNHNHDEKGRFCSGRGGGRFSSGNSAKSLDNSGESDIISIASNAHPRNIELEKTIQKCINSPLPIFADDLKAVRKIKPPNNEYVVGLHGSDTNTWIFGMKIDAKILANIIKSRKDYNGENIYLFSCNTGNTTRTQNCFAQQLANKLNVIVYAPTEYGVIWSNGKHYSGKTDFTPSGEIRPFKPGE